MTLPRAVTPTAVHWVTGAGGARLHVPEFGRPDAPPLLLVHGWSQSHLSWAHQLAGPLAGRFRIIAPDLRGHGLSDKPGDAASYDSSAPWAGDFAAIIAQLGLQRPVAVGWSMGGKVLQDYLRLHGDAALAGLVLVGTAATSGRFMPATATAARTSDPDVAAEGMYGDDLDANLRATAAFVRACTAQPPSPDALAYMVGFNMLCPPPVRAACRLRHEDYKPALAGVSCPALIIAGAKERLMPAALTDELRAALPHARTEIYESCGHAPFWEAPERFDADLMEFANSCQKEAA